MGRGLSRLQRQILCLALEEKFISCQELISRLWGLQPRKRGSQNPAIDGGRYSSIHVILSKSLTGLWSRGLIEYWRTLSLYRTAITLTHEGKVLAKAILAEDQKKQSNG
jgi:hypothetical protein